MFLLDALFMLKAMCNAYKNCFDDASEDFSFILIYMCIIVVSRTC